MTRTYPCISTHETLHGTLEVNWDKDYIGGFICPGNCGNTELFLYTSTSSVDKSIRTVRVRCKSCRAISSLQECSKQLLISSHETLYEPLQINWRTDYDNSFQCPKECGSRNLRMRWKQQKVLAECKKCDASSSLKAELRVPCISVHETLNGTIQVNWRADYDNTFQCPKGCGSRELYFASIDKVVRLTCKKCTAFSVLSNIVSPRIYNYRPDVECPNPNCKNGWVYLLNQLNGKEMYYCDTCNIKFTGNSDEPGSWTGRYQQRTTSFCFEDDVWDLRNFFKNPRDKFLTFTNLTPLWYQERVKQFLYVMLKRKLNGWSSIQTFFQTLRLFSQIVEQREINRPEEIDRQTIQALLQAQHGLNTRTICLRLGTLTKFFDWLGLDTSKLIHKRDFPKMRFNDAEWLDEAVRNSIRQHLYKIPSPIARQYQIQEYTAARLGSACTMPLDCLFQEDGRCYIQFFQDKVQREHRVPATREIQKLIEEQQQWIRETFGPNYSYLFCHFRGVCTNYYPEFLAMKPLLEPPLCDSRKNQMVRILNMLIKKEDIKDSNGVCPYFVGKITRHSRLQEVREQFGIQAASAYAGHKSPTTTFKYYAPPSREEVAEADLPFQKLLLNRDNRFLPWQTLPESLLNNPQAHEVDIELSPRLTVYGFCGLEDPKQRCPKDLYPKCYGCSSFRPSTDKLPLYERQYAGEQKRIAEAEIAKAEVACEEAKSTIEAMNLWLPELRDLANG